MQKNSYLALGLGLLSLAACDPYQPTMRPDYTIKVVNTPKGSVAIPPTCPSWSHDITDPYDAQPFPQYGCANARNLALNIERPEDLVKGRELGPERGVNGVGTIRRYDNNQTRGLIDPQSTVDSVVSSTTSSAPASALSGDVTGGAPAAASSAASAAGP